LWFHREDELFCCRDHDLAPCLVVSGSIPLLAGAAGCLLIAGGAPESSVQGCSARPS